MQIDPAAEWTRLTRLYAAKTDAELDELAADFSSLTEIAQSVLRDELRRRGLPSPQPPPQPRHDRRVAFPTSNHPIAGQNRELETEGVVEAGQSSSGLPVEYTWKTTLCACDTRQQAWQISELLKRVGIESWIEAPSQDSLDVTGPRVIVPADQLDEARSIASQPIPQDIVDQSKTPIEDFVPPACPKCGATDPLLDSVEPSNQWRCDLCGATWSEPAVVPSQPSS